MKTITDFKPADRYVYDMGICSSGKGFAQVDTSQDAHYFGTWANPTTLQIVCYCEGDVTLQTAETKWEFIETILKLVTWEHYTFKGIDPMCNESIEKGFRELGLGNLLH